MIELDDVEYNIKTPEENAQELVSKINDYCTQNDVRNLDGDLIQIEANEANPLYMMCFGMGYLVADIQKLIYSAGCSMSIPESSERQLLNLADIANVRRQKATKTTVTVTIYAEYSPDVDEDDPNYEEPTPCFIDSSLTVSVPYGESTITFSPAYETVIQPDEAVSMVLICNQEGSYSIEAGTITNFDTNPEGFRKMESLASSPGQVQETIQNLRARLQERDSNYTQIDGAISAIKSLDGVSSCNIYFNYSSTVSYIINDVTVPPRQALLCVQGYSDKIAETFYSHLFCLTAGEDSDRCLQQTYETLSGQPITVNILSPVYVPVYISIYLKGLYSTDEQNDIKDTVCTLASSLSVGQLLTSADVIKLLQDTYPSYTIQGCDLSKTSFTESTSYKLTPTSSELFTFSTANIRLDIDTGD